MLTAPEAIRTALPARVAASTVAVAALVLAWFAVQLARFLGEAPDLDAMVSLRESIVFHREGLGGLIDASVGTGIHPPALDVLSALTFSLFGEDPRSQQLLAVGLFVVVAVAAERLLAPWLQARERVAGAFAVAICPSLAVTLFLVSREGLLLAALLCALVLALTTDRPLALGLTLAALPLIKETGLVLVAPFALDALLRGGVRRALRVLGPAVVAALAWRGVLALTGAASWHAWVVSDSADKGPYLVALRAMLGFEDVHYLRQNLENAFVVNYLWVPALLAVGTGVRLWRRGGPPGLRRAVALIAGLGLLYTWTALTFPTFTVPRYAAPLTLLTILVAVLGLPLWPRGARPPILGVLIAAFLLGAWSPTDPVSRALYGTVSVGGEQIYDTAEFDRGPDRMAVNFAALRATERVNARLRRVFASDVAYVTGDCNTMKFGEKLFSVGFTPSAYDRTIPRARPIRCVPLDQLAPGAANGSEKIGLLRTVEDDVNDVPLQLSGSAVTVLR